jgi:hypothetical protein
MRSLHEYRNAVRRYVRCRYGDRALRTVPLIVLVALAGCGGSKLSAHDQFVARADAICAKSAQRAKALKAPNGNPSPAYIDRANKLLAETSRELAAVKPPPEARAGYQRFLTAAQREIGLLRQLAAYLRATDLPRAGAILPKLNKSTVNSEARTLGLKKCVSS